MAIFQNAVIQEHLGNLDKKSLDSSWDKFKKYFLDEKRQQNILKQKEEQFQEGFLRELFVNILGYTINPDPGFNIITELKNQKGAKKADGAIVNGKDVLSVIELKSTKTTDLSSFEVQAFNYKNNQQGCRLVITSNFKKVRLYVDNAVENIEWDLFSLTRKDFEILYLCLSKHSVLNKIPIRLKEDSISHEQYITKKYYKEYSSFRKGLFNSIVKNNSSYNKLLLFKKTQKLLDRFLFLFFAEDRQLVPANSVRKILDKWTDLRDEYDEYVPLYDRFKKYFNYLDKGHKTPQHEIFAYNGGLFESDSVLDNIKIDDTILYDAAKCLSEYNYNSGVDVNILGHIFEHSLTEIEEIEKKLSNEETSPTVKATSTKRKKDGVFYTPKYITRYIVNSSIGKICNKKKVELNIREENYTPTKSQNRNTKRESLAQLEAYKEWLLKLTILDPACGSGAFLNEALDFLITEHKWISELEARLTKSKIVFDLENSILENNLFGVDINEESVEIAKLSLWLRTAQRGRKLTSLNNNIKKGNSLNDSKNIGKNKLFNWALEFPEIIKNGGFDIIIGNPPYGAKITEAEKEYYRDRFPESTEGKIDTYKIFFQKGFEILKDNGILSFITPNTFLYNTQSKRLRKLIIDGTTIEDAVELRKNIFEDAPDVVTVILTITKKKSETYEFRGRVAFHNKVYTDIENDSWESDQIISKKILLEDSEYKINLRSNLKFASIKAKIEKHPILDKFVHLKQGTKPYKSKTEKSIELLSNYQIDTNWEKAINGKNISRYYITEEDLYVKRSDDVHSLLPSSIINKEKIYFQRMRKISLFPRLVCSYDNNNIHGLYTCSVIYQKTKDLNLKYILTILNSLLINLWYKYFDTDIEIKLTSVNKIPIPHISDSLQKPFIQKAEFMNLEISKYTRAKQSFIKVLQANFSTLEITKVLNKIESLSFKTFIKELGKQKIQLAPSKQSEWLTYFEKEQQKVLASKKLIDKTNDEINKMVCDLYGLTKTEIDLVKKLSS
jgi:tRNA1(Val) A37 N6-methylase TrmN6